MRILIVATQLRLPGRHGGSTHVSELAANLGKFGEVLIMAQLGSAQSGVVGVGLPIRTTGTVNRIVNYAYLPFALSIARRFRPDAIYERGSSYGLGMLLSKRMGVPMLCMVLDEHVTRASLVHAKKIISTTETTVPDEFRDKYVKVSWGANADAFHPEVKPVQSPLLSGFEGVTAGYVGSFKRWHGLDDLVAAAVRLKAKPLRWLMLGDGPERQRIEQLTVQAGVRDQFVFTGALEYRDVPGWVAAMDICLAPFRPEEHGASQGNFVLDPLKVFEYLAMSKPTITVDTPNIRSLVEHEEHALLVPSGDLNALVGALERTMGDPEAAKQMAERGRQLVLEKHTWYAHAKHLNSLFQEMTTA